MKKADMTNVDSVELQFLKKLLIEKIETIEAALDKPKIDLLRKRLIKLVEISDNTADGYIVFDKNFWLDCGEFEHNVAFVVTGANKGKNRILERVGEKISNRVPFDYNFDAGDLVLVFLRAPSMIEWQIFPLKPTRWTT